MKFQRRGNQSGALLALAYGALLALCAVSAMPAPSAAGETKRVCDCDPLRCGNFWLRYCCDGNDCGCTLWSTCDWPR